MKKRDFIKRVTLSAFAFPLMSRCIDGEDSQSIIDEDGTDSSDTAGDCILTNSETAGPYPTHSPGSLLREDITGGRTGIPLDVEITVLNNSQSCLPIENARVDIWHCDKDGNYSEYGSYTSASFLRGRQVTDENGKVAFTTIFPGWYNGRSTHIHVHIYNESGTSLLVTQIAFPEGSNSAVVQVNASTENGYTKGMNGYTYNSQDNVFSDGVSNELSNISGSVSSGFNLTHSIVVKA
ncbi:intradiol ring-cleavage dioxygenase [Algoriphagus vanfongensis]|uniref:dioxygenase family protein n=1 Tax=Algoriphagus vanfongensis TaxID=426371 RepID=UPI000414BADB|nr:intradiol ring-cleavage dioxygenase [Algoriphagus vanfongensis]